MSYDECTRLKKCCFYLVKLIESFMIEVMLESNAHINIETNISLTTSWYGKRRKKKILLIFTRSLVFFFFFFFLFSYEKDHLVVVKFHLATLNSLNEMVRHIPYVKNSRSSCRIQLILHLTF